MKLRVLAWCAILAAAGACSPGQPATAPEAAQQQTVNNVATAPAGEVRLDAPAPASRASSPLSIAGVAPATWYYEGKFPVLIVSPDGHVVAQGIAHAQSSGASIPFKADIEFSVTSDMQAELVLHNANPGDRPDYAEEVRFPLTLSPAS